MVNKKENLRLRDEAFRNLSAQQRAVLADLENLYGKYCYLPLDVPRIVDSKIIDWFFNHCKEIVKLHPDVADKNYGYSLFNSVNVCLDDRYRVHNPIWSDNQYPNFQKEFPHFYQQLMDCLPLDKIPRLSFWNSTKPIAPHRDHNCFFDLPNSFRVLIYDENPADNLYLFEDSDLGHGDKHYIKRLDETNAFVWNNLRVMHGSDYVPGYRKILLIINNFIPNHIRYKKCLDDSISRFSQLSLVSNLNIDNFI